MRFRDFVFTAHLACVDLEALDQVNPICADSELLVVLLQRAKWLTCPRKCHVLRDLFLRKVAPSERI